MKRLIIIIFAIIIILPIAINAQDNIFHAATGSNWYSSGNWSTGKVPPKILIQEITITDDCVVPSSDTSSFYFLGGVALRINPDVSLTNNSSGDWIMQGTVINNGTYRQSNLENEGIFTGNGTFYGNMTNSGLIEPGNIVEMWVCGDPIVYGGRIYPTVQIGGQCWMAKNLNVGSMILDSFNQTNDSILEKYCSNNNSNDCNTYGALYQWNEMMQYYAIEGTQGVCPTGWHLPSDGEIKILEGQLGMSSTEIDNEGGRGTNEGSKLAGSAWLWNDGALENDAEFDTSGFNAVPAGLKRPSHHCESESFLAVFWSSTGGDTDAWHRYIYKNDTKIDRYKGDKMNGMAVRCVRD